MKTEYTQKILSIKVSFDDILASGEGRKFNVKDAEIITSFVKSLDDQIDTLWFCCDSGVSRSSALAAAFTRYYHKEEMKIWSNPQYSPNSLVYQIQCESLGMRVSPFTLWIKTKISKRALAKAIKRGRSHR